MTSSDFVLASNVISIGYLKQFGDSTNNEKVVRVEKLREFLRLLKEELPELIIDGWQQHKDIRKIFDEYIEKRAGNL